VFERLTDQAREAVVRAQEEARRLGDGTIDPLHLLLGVLTVDGCIAQLALAGLGVTADAVRATRPPSGPVVSEGHLPFEDDTKAALECALRESITHRSRNLTTGHLLLGVIAHKPTAAPAPEPPAVLSQGPIAVRPAVPGVHRAATGVGLTVTTVAGVTVDVAAVRAAVWEEAKSGRGPESTGPIWSDLDLGPAPDRLPRSGVLATVVTILCFALLSAAVLGLTWDEAGPEIFGTGFVGAAVLFGLPAALAARRVTAKHVSRLPLALDPPPEVVAVLASRGLTAEIRVASGRFIRDRCYRRGSTAWIVLSPRTLARPRSAGFVMAHEVAHLLRNDHARYRVVATLALAVVMGSYLTLDLRAWLIGFGGVLGLQLVSRWRTELDCDAFAARWTSAEALRAWADDHRALLREPQNRRGRRRRRVRNFMTHPPLALRVALRRDRQSASPR
jgi:hypothetical protein